MSRRCDFCGKGTQYGNRVSKAYNHTRHVWRPNLVKMRVVGINGPTKICTQCLRKLMKNNILIKKVRVPKTSTEQA